MTHHDKGRFAAKHPEGTRPDPEIAAALKEKATDGRVSCAAAHKIASKLNRSPAEVGKTLDLLENRISRCQMGFFGYQPEKKIVAPAKQVADELKTALADAASNGRVPCASAWKIAEDMGLSKLDVGAACEALGLKVSPCQLGAF